MDACLRYDPKRDPLNPPAPHPEGDDAGDDRGAPQPREPVLRDHQPEGAIGRGEQPSSDGSPLLLIRIEKCGISAPLYDQGQFPRQVVGVLQTGVHALRPHRAVDVGCITEHETATHPEVFGGAMMDAIGGEPKALRELQCATGFASERWNHCVEGHVLPVPKFLRQDTDDPPVIPAARKGLDLGPACQQCGGMMQRTGSCYTCSSCGFNTGCG